MRRYKTIKNETMPKINTRSPYFINITTPNITSAVLDLYIYTGTQVATMDSITYSLEGSVYNGYVSFEISQLISDYLDVTYNGVNASQVAWVNYQVTETINNVATTPSAIVQTVAFDGYGYFEDEVNPQLSDKLLQSNDKLTILDNNYDAGTAPSIRIRGTGSITASSEPLWVVDGVISSANAFNPNDVESITVMKDAGATGLYGSKASGGVIVVTTKKGKAGKGIFNITTASGFNKPLWGNFKGLMNSEQIYDYHREAVNNYNI